MSHRNSIPKYRRHTASGQAIVTLTDPAGQRRDYYLGKYGSAASKAEYSRLVAEWSASGRCIPHTGPTPPDLSVSELLVRFWAHVQVYYRHPDGRPTSEVDNFRLSLRPLRALYGHTRATDFGPLALKAIRASMIEAGLSRKLINQRIGRIRRAFKWAVSEQLIPASILQGLQSVDGLDRGRSAAVESSPVRPVADELVNKTLPYLNRHVAGMVRFQRLVGCRPQDCTNLRRCDIDTSGAVWIYRPPLHKTSWRGKERMIAIGPKAQEVLAEFPTTVAEEHVFSPARMTAERMKLLRSTRVTAVQPSQVCRAKPKPRKRPGEKYTPRSFHQAIHRACEKAGLDQWHPNQLRHSRGTEVRRKFGLEAAQVVLGHSQAKVTEIYAESDAELAMKVAAETG